MTYAQGQSAVCPHCQQGGRLEALTLKTGAGLSAAEVDYLLLRSKQGHLVRTHASSCPTCGEIILYLVYGGDPTCQVKVGKLLWPSASSRPVPAEVESVSPGLAVDYREAVAVLPESKKASAALSRRCLQFILVDRGGAKKKDLYDQIA